MAMDRVEVFRSETKVINRAAQVAQNHSNSGVGSTPAPAREVTSAGVDGDGNIYTIHDFMLSVDTLGDPAAQLRVKGKVTIYGS
jgi:hypothetical protein